MTDTTSVVTTTQDDESFNDLLKQISIQDERYPKLSPSFQNLNSEFGKIGDRNGPVCGELTVFDFEKPKLQQTYEICFNSKGWPISKSSNQVLKELEQLPSITDSSIRVFFLTYHVAPYKYKTEVYGPGGLSLPIVNYMMQQYDVDLKLIQAPFETPCCIACRISTNRLPSMQRVIGFRMAGGFCCAQVCASRREPSSKAVFVIMQDTIGAGVPTGLQHHIASHPEYKAMLASVKRTQQAEHSAWPEVLDVLNACELKSGSSNTQDLSYAALCRYMLMKNRYDAGKVLNNPLELIVPIIQISALRSSLWTRDALFGSQSTINRLMNSRQGTGRGPVPHNEMRGTKADDMKSVLAGFSKLDYDRQSLLTLLQDVELFFGKSAELSQSPQSVISDINYIIRKHDIIERTLREKLSITASLASLQESRIGINESRSVTQLTQLAVLFIPLSLVTSAFGMNIDLLSSPHGVKWWTVLVGTIIIYALFAMPVFNIFHDGSPVKMYVRRHCKSGQQYTKSIWDATRGFSSSMNKQIAEMILVSRLQPSEHVDLTDHA